MAKRILSQKEKRKRFEAREVYKKKGLSKKLTPTGYEAYRVSPRTTIKYGKKYRKIYGATVEPDYKRKAKGKYKYGAKVKWFPHAYTTSSVKGGTRTLQNLKNYPVNVKEARRKLMLKRKRRKK